MVNKIAITVNVLFKCLSNYMLSKNETQYCILNLLRFFAYFTSTNVTIFFVLFRCLSITNNSSQQKENKLFVIYNFQLQISFSFSRVWLMAFSMKNYVSFGCCSIEHKQYLFKSIFLCCEKRKKCYEYVSAWNLGITEELKKT